MYGLFCPKCQMELYTGATGIACYNDSCDWKPSISDQVVIQANFPKMKVPSGIIEEGRIAYVLEVEQIMPDGSTEKDQWGFHNENGVFVQFA